MKISNGKKDSDLYDETVRVLVVDDDEFMQDLLTRYLRRQTFDVIAAGEVPQALQYAMKTDFDIAVIDILLGPSDGIELVDSLREIQPDLICIIMTGHPTLETALQAIARGVHDYLIKPFKLEQLDDVIRKCLHDKHSRQEIQRLQAELKQARETIERYEAVLGHGHRIAPVSGTGAAPLKGSGAEVRLSAYKKNQLELEKQLENLKLLRDEDLIDEEEYARRHKSLKSRISKGM